MKIKDQFTKLIINITNKGFFYLVSSNFLVGLFSFGLLVLITKFLSPIQLGQIKTLQSFSAVAFIISGFGFNIAVLKLCSESRPLEEKEFIFKKNFTYTFFTVIVISIIIYFSAKLELLSPDKGINKWMSVYVLIIPSMTYIFLIIAFLQSQKMIKTIAKFQFSMRALNFIVIVSATYHYGFIGYIVAAISMTYILLTPLIYMVRDSFKRKKYIDKLFLQSFNYAKWGVAANGIMTLGDYIDIFMLNYLVKDRIGFGYYSIATIFILAINQITNTVQTITMPYFSEKCHNKNEFIRVLAKYEKLMLILSICVMTIAIAIVPLFIEKFYGSNYAAAGGYFRILALKYFFWSCYALLGTAIFGLGKIKYNVITSSIAVFTTIILTYFLINTYGIKGAAIGQVLGAFISLILTVCFLKHALKIHFDNHENITSFLHEKR